MIKACQMMITALQVCQPSATRLGDLPLGVAYERLAGMVRRLGEDVQARLCATPTPPIWPRRTPSLGAVSALLASMGSVSTLSSCTSAT
jgi:hypothetical protein